MEQPGVEQLRAAGTDGAGTDAIAVHVYSNVHNDVTFKCNDWSNNNWSTLRLINLCKIVAIYKISTRLDKIQWNGYFVD